jgi:predicted acyltransferase
MTTETPAASKPDPLAGRLVSLDVYRGFVMCLMALEGAGIGHAARTFPNNPWWQALAYQFDHVPWIGCSLWDMIQPSFTFIVGVATPYSISARLAKGHPWASVWRHAVLRALMLVALGIFLRSDGKLQTYFTFEDTLTQIGLGYAFLYLLWNRPVKTQVAAVTVVLLGYWLAWALYPVAPADYNWEAVGVKPDWQRLTGFQAHWEKNANLGHAFEVWFRNLFPNEKPFVRNGGGYLTLSFIPTFGTMVLGMLAGGLMRSSRPASEKTRELIKWGVLGVVVGWGLGLLGVCPVVKRIWTPTWTIYSAGWCCLMLAFFYHVVDVKGKTRWAFPLLVVGVNSIAMYVLSHLWRHWIEETLKTHLGQNIFHIFGERYHEMVQQAAVFAVLWCICWWMYRRRLFIRI